MSNGNNTLFHLTINLSSREVYRYGIGNLSGLRTFCVVGMRSLKFSFDSATTNLQIELSVHNGISDGKENSDTFIWFIG